MSTIRTGIADAINEINKLIAGGASAAEAKQLRKQRLLLMAQLTEVLEEEIRKDTKKYKAALDALDQATREAKAALDDVDKVAGTIRKVATAIKKVESVIKLGIRVV
jgi:hypothetical protein